MFTRVHIRVSRTYFLTPEKILPTVYCRVGKVKRTGLASFWESIQKKRKQWTLCERERRIIVRTRYRSRKLRAAVAATTITTTAASAMENAYVSGMIFVRESPRHFLLLLLLFFFWMNNLTTRRCKNPKLLWQRFFHSRLHRSPSMHVSNCVWSVLWHTNTLKRPHRKIYFLQNDRRE